MDPPEVAAYSSIFAAAASEVNVHPEKYHGSYIKPSNVIGEQSPVASDPVRQDEVWRFMTDYLERLSI
jgi:hypothetical protein